MADFCSPRQASFFLLSFCFRRVQHVSSLPPNLSRSWLA
jgi:hypothetical protein